MLFAKQNMQLVHLCEIHETRQAHHILYQNLLDSFHTFHVNGDSVHILYLYAI